MDHARVSPRLVRGDAVLLLQQQHARAGLAALEFQRGGGAHDAAADDHQIGLHAATLRIPRTFHQTRSTTAAVPASSSHSAPG